MKPYVYLALCACLVGLAGGVIYFTRQNAQPDSYLNVSLGMDMAKVFYAKGSPKSVSNPDDSLRRNGNASTDEVSGDGLDEVARSHYLEWTFGKYGYIELDFDAATRDLKKITCIDFRSVASEPAYSQSHPDDDPPCPPLVGVIPGMEEEKVVRLLGKPSTEIENPNVKIVTYRRQGMAIMYRTNKVVSLSLDQDAR